MLYLVVPAEPGDSWYNFAVFEHPFRLRLSTCKYGADALDPRGGVRNIYQIFRDIHF